MLYGLEELNGPQVDASDDEVGTIKGIYCDDHRWTVRYVVVETASWLVWGMAPAPMNPAAFFPPVAEFVAVDRGHE